MQSAQSMSIEDSQIPEQSTPWIPNYNADPLQGAPGCLLYDPSKGEYTALHPFKKITKVIEDEFIDMSFLDNLTAIPVTEDGGTIKYVDPNMQDPVQKVSDQENTQPNENKEDDPNLPPESLARVRIRYEGRKEDGELIDKIRDRKQLRAFKLHNDDMIPGIHFAAGSLRKGEVSWFKFLPDYHYGPQGAPPLVAPNSNLYYKVELVDYTNMKKILTNDDYDGRIALLG